MLGRSVLEGGENRPWSLNAYHSVGLNATHRRSLSVPPTRVAGASTSGFALTRVLGVDHRGTVARADLASPFRASQVSGRAANNVRYDTNAGLSAPWSHGARGSPPRSRVRA